MDDESARTRNKRHSSPSSSHPYRDCPSAQRRPTLIARRTDQGQLCRIVLKNSLLIFPLSLLGWADSVTRWSFTSQGYARRRCAGLILAVSVVPPNTRIVCPFNTVLNDWAVGIPFADMRSFVVECALTCWPPVLSQFECLNAVQVRTHYHSMRYYDWRGTILVASRK
jgi:hypothetical protein